MRKLFLPAIIFFTLWFLSSCFSDDRKDALYRSMTLSGENKKELQKVLDHYKAPKDRVKLQAAKYLISNMKGHSYWEFGDTYKKAFEKARKTRKHLKETQVNGTWSQIGRGVNAVFRKAIDSIEKSIGFKASPKKIFDVQMLTADFLIENIEVAFAAHSKKPHQYRESFDEFLKYVLPYRVIDEPIEKHKRKELFEKYKWALDSLKIHPMDTVVSQIYNSLELYGGVWGKKYKYPGVPSLSEMEATRFGDCGYITAYFINVLRSVGIPSGTDYCTRWGVNGVQGVHTWAFYINGKKKEAVNVGMPDFKKTNALYVHAGIPKVFRKNFDKSFKKDVTKEYRKAYDFEIENLWGRANLLSENVFLGVFNQNGTWDKVIQSSAVDENRIRFKQIGSNLLYVVFSEDFFQRKLLNYPFELTKNGRLRFLNKNNQTLDAAFLTRKYPPFTVRNEKRKIQRIQSINTCVLQGSTFEAPTEFQDLFTIANFYSTLKQTFRISNSKPFSNYRLKGPKGEIVNLAEFHLLDKNSNEIKQWKSIELMAAEKQTSPKNVIDHKSLTSRDLKDMFLTYSFDTPICISGFTIQAQNDGNHINKGDLYELFYWDKDWISLGEKHAKDTVLTYYEIPKNTLYWLQNNSRGKEEFVFTFDNKGNQVWTGVSDYEFVNLDSILLAQNQ